MQPDQQQKSPSIMSPQPVASRERSTARHVRESRSLQRTLGAGDEARWFLLSGGRLFCVQTLTGMFPDTGWHQPGEMGGLWSPPIKLFDGYWIGLRTPPAAAQVSAGAESGSTLDGYDAITWLTQPDAWELTNDGAVHRYVLPELDLAVTRRAWVVPDTSALVLDVWLEALGDLRPLDVVHTVECAFVARSDLLGAWLTEERPGPGVSDDVGAYDDELGAIVLTNTQDPARTACVGAVDAVPVAHVVGPLIWGPQRTAGRGVGAALWYRASVAANAPAHLRFLLTGPAANGADARLTFQTYMGSAVALERLNAAHALAVARFQAPFMRCALHTPDAVFDDIFAWSKANLAWLQLTIPRLGSAPMAGIPDFPWWLGCDTEYGVLPMLVAGQGAEAAAALRTLATLSQHANGNGRVLHEISSSGEISEHGNLVETPLFTRALYHVYRWTGDRALLRDLYPFCAQGLLGYTLGKRLPADEVIPQGRSIVETPEMHAAVQTLDVGAYTAEALGMLADLQDELKALDSEATLSLPAHIPSSLQTSVGMRAESSRIKRHLRDEWWLPKETFFADVRASEDELRCMLARLETQPAPDPSVLLSISRLRDALARNDERPEREPPMQRRPWLFLHHEQALAAEAGLPTPEQAEGIFSRLATQEWRTEYGIVLNAATDRRVMSLPNGALAVALARYGMADSALDAIQRLMRAFGKAAPGTISEFSPEGGCFLQLWSSYGVIWPVVRYFLGLDPDVARRHLICAPHLPTAWPSVRLDAVPLGDTMADVEVEVSGDTTRVRLTLSDPRWEVRLGVVGLADVRMPAATLSGELVAVEWQEGFADGVGGAGQWGRWLTPAVSGARTWELRLQKRVPVPPTLETRQGV